jgi:CBS domain-containing protein
MYHAERRMKTVKMLLDNKGHEVHSIGPEASVYDALELMADKSIGSLIVLDDGAPVGIFSERDYACKVELEGRSSKTTPVKEIMTTPVIYARPEQTVEECMVLVTEKRVRHLPVMEGDRLIGLVSIGDLVKSIIAEQQFIIEQLEQYINR